ncbi:MAG: hypothetical protein GW778_02760 [Alphaproteobacteria bacterium]|nr:hypothetical protein [Alphaproteobacteria bacterium]
MVDLSYSPNAQNNIPFFTKDISLEPADIDPLAPMPIPEESGLTEYFNVQGGAYVGPQNDIGGYAALGWGRDIDGLRPEDGQSGDMSNLSFGGTAGVKVGHDTGGVVGFVQGGFSYKQGTGGWDEPKTETYEAEVFDDDYNVIGTETVTEETTGHHYYDTTETILSASGNAYADTTGFFGVDANMGVSLTNNGHSIGGGIYGGYNSDDGGSACLHGSASQAIDDTWSAYGHAQICAGAEKSGAEAGIRGHLSLTEGGLFDNVPVSVGVGIDQGGGGPEVRASVIGFQF